jgi:membrane protein DedA with SNARE-associated domain
MDAPPQTANDEARPAVPAWVGPLLLVGVVGLWVLGTVTSASSPKLLKSHPLLLMALNPRYRFMVVAAPKIGFPQFLAIGVGRLMLSDPLYFFIGKLYGNRAVGWFADAMGGADRPGNLVTTTAGWFNKAWGEVLVALACGPIVCVLAGAAKMKWKRFLLLDLVGTTIIVTALRLFSKAIEPWIRKLLNFNDKHSTALLFVAIAFTALFVLQGASGMRRRIKGLRDLTNDK